VRRAPELKEAAPSERLLEVGQPQGPGLEQARRQVAAAR
jgi:hypothetical protein